MTQEGLNFRRTRFEQLWREAGLAGDPGPVHQELALLYSQGHRDYHNLRHIGECLDEFESGRNLAQEPLAVELAIWFHDAIYDTHAHDNEERSATLARSRISDAGGSERLCNSVQGLVMATKTHDPSIYPDAPLMVDIDLSILGQSDQRFDEYESQIRREYDWAPEEIFAAKRAEILEGFCARERIYSMERSMICTSKRRAGIWKDQ